MTLEQLKLSIQNKTLDDSSFIFVCKDIDFIAYQYIDSIIKFKQYPLDNDFDINNIDNGNLFGYTPSIKVYKTDCFDLCKEDIRQAKTLYIICSKLSEEASLYYNNIIVIDKLHSWQITDYVYSVTKGVATNKLDHLIKVCKGDIYRLEQETSKIRIFEESQRDILFNHFTEDNIFSDLSDHTIFDFSNALLKKDINSLASLYKEIENIDCEPLGLLTILIKQIRNIILVQLNPAPDERNTGLTSKQIWAIKKFNCGIYTKDQLLKIFDIINDIDRKIKVGDMPMNLLIDYLVVSILSV